MPQTSPYAAVLTELEPVVAENLDRHDRIAKEWHPHDYVPWDEGRNFAFLGGEDWSPEQSRLDETAKAAMFVNLLTEDNLPSYHREIATRFGRDGAWGTVGGPLDGGGGPARCRPARLPRRHPRRRPGRARAGPDGLHDHRLRLRRQDAARGGRLRLVPGARPPASRTGTPARPPATRSRDKLLARIATDENLHMIFYRNIVTAAFDINPDEMMKAVATEVINFEMPGANMANFRKNSIIIAKAGIYDLRLHFDEVVSPILRTWKVFERTDFGPEGEKAREELALFLAGLDEQATKFVDNRERMRARIAARGEVPVQV